MNKALIQSILEHTKLYKTSSIPIEISQTAYRESGFSFQQLRQLNDDIRQMVGAFINSNTEYDEAQLEIIFHMQLKDEVDSYTSDLANKYQCNPQDIFNFTVWAVYKELAKLMFNRGYILRGIDCYTLQKQAEIIAEATGGRSFAEIKNLAPKPIKIGEERLKIKIKLLAKAIWREDEERRLMPSHVIDMIVDLWEKKPNNDYIRSPNRILEWFQEDNNTIPPDIKLITDSKKYPRGRKNKIIREEEMARIKLTVKPYVDQLIQEFKDGLY